jgi:hypothetical protein
MKMVYVAGPFRASTPEGIAANVRVAEALALRVWKMGHPALCPHLNTQNFDGLAPDSVWLDGDLYMLSKCEAIVMTHNWQQSSGATAERRFAIEHDIPVFYGGSEFSMNELASFLNS